MLDVVAVVAEERRPYVHAGPDRSESLDQHRVPFLGRAGERRIVACHPGGDAPVVRRELRVVRDVELAGEHFFFLRALIHARSIARQAGAAAVCDGGRHSANATCTMPAVSPIATASRQARS